MPRRAEATPRRAEAAPRRLCGAGLSPPFPRLAPVGGSAVARNHPHSQGHTQGQVLIMAIRPEIPVIAFFPHCEELYGKKFFRLGRARQFSKELYGKKSSDPPTTQNFIPCPHARNDQSLKTPSPQENQRLMIYIPFTVQLSGCILHHFSRFTPPTPIRR